MKIEQNSLEWNRNKWEQDRNKIEVDGSKIEWDRNNRLQDIKKKNQESVKLEDRKMDQFPSDSRMFSNATKKSR